MQYTILVVDDDVYLAQVLKMGLERMSYQVIEAFSGQEGLQSAAESRPDLILLDVMLPDISGWDVCRRLRRLFDVPIIILTARSSASDIVKGVNSGADDVIIKPFDLFEVTARIRSLLPCGSDARMAPSHGLSSAAANA